MTSLKPQMSTCMSGASGRTYGFDFDFLKSPSPSSTSSPSSTISESTDSPLTISTRKSRTPRKRPNQTYNEAASLLSTAYPNLFPSNSLQKPNQSTKTPYSSFPSNEPPELFFPFQVLHTSSFLIKDVNFPLEPKAVNLPELTCQSPGEISSQVINNTSYNYNNGVNDICGEDFDAESILDEEIGEGVIDSIMGSRVGDFDGGAWCHDEHVDTTEFDIGGKFDFGLRAIRGGVDEGNYCWGFPAVVNMSEISPEIKMPAAVTAETAAEEAPEKKVKRKKKVKKVEEIGAKVFPTELPTERSISEAKSKGGLLLKLNYGEVLDAWSDRSSPFAGESPVSDVAGNDIAARLAQIDLLWENGEGVMREASVMRYKEKRRSRLFSKKIRYQVRKVNADQRPRSQGRFARRPNGCSNAQSSKSKKSKAGLTSDHSQ